MLQSMGSQKVRLDLATKQQQLDIPSESSRIHILLKCTQNILWDYYILGHKSSLSKLKKIEILSSIFSNHKAMKLEIN